MVKKSVNNTGFYNNCLKPYAIFAKVKFLTFHSCTLFLCCAGATHLF